MQREGQAVSKENMEKLTETMLISAGIQATGQIVNGIMDIRKMKMPTKSKTTISEDRYDKKGNYSGGKTTTTTTDSRRVNLPKRRK